jgi:hypothetical protein
MLLALLQEETTGLAGAKKVVKDAAREPLAIFKGIGDFLEEAYAYITSGDFIGDVVASVAVVLAWASVLPGSDAGIPGFCVGGAGGKGFWTRRRWPASSGRTPRSP